MIETALVFVAVLVIAAWLCTPWTSGRGPMKPTQLLFQVLLGIGVSVATVAIVEAIRESNAKKTLPGSGLPPGHGYA